jgi:hypothetical protein
MFLSIGDALKPHGLAIPETVPLTADGQLYRLLAIQPAGNVHVEQGYIGPADRAKALSQFGTYFELASSMKAELVLAPEYSCPQDALVSAIRGGDLPPLGALWIIGLEAVTKRQLADLKEQCKAVTWIHEDVADNGGRFLDIVAYLFKSHDSQNVVRDVAMLQFKTQPMAGTFERNNLLTGKTKYILHAPSDTIRMLSLVCSDALTFAPAVAAACRFDIHPYIVFHPQLNVAPRHPDMAAYRAALFALEVSERIEVISLNWARGFAFATGDGSRSQYGGSTLYTKSPQFDRSDERVTANLAKGVYYAHWHARRTDLALFNYDEHVFEMRLPKPFQHTGAVLRQRTGPEMLSLRRWNGEAGAWEVDTTPDDGFGDLCASYKEGDCNYCSSPPHTPIDRERLLTLSSGKLLPRVDWHRLDLLPSFMAASDERSQRLTFTHEPVAESREFRAAHLERFVKLQMYVLTDISNWPHSIADLRDEWRLEPPTAATNFRHNLVSASGNAPGATVMYLALESPAAAAELRDSLISAWGAEHTRRLVIWHEAHNAIQTLTPPVPTIGDDDDHPASFTRGAR